MPAVTKQGPDKAAWQIYCPKVPADKTKSWRREQRMDGFLETVAETRFSDFSSGGTLHFSKPLMYFEKARFAVAEKSCIFEVLRAVRPGAEITFVVIRVRLDVRETVRLPAGEVERPMRVRTWLDPTPMYRMTFRQQLLDATDETVLVEALIDVVILVDGEVLRQYPAEVRECLETYQRNLNNSGREGN